MRENTMIKTPDELYRHIRNNPRKELTEDEIKLLLAGCDFDCDEEEPTNKLQDMADEIIK